jgi:hypothetical protein
VPPKALVLDYEMTATDAKQFAAAYECASSTVVTRTGNASRPELQSDSPEGE